jgi:hypothetical protein
MSTTERPRSARHERNELDSRGDVARSATRPAALPAFTFADRLRGARALQRPRLRDDQCHSQRNGNLEGSGGLFGVEYAGPRADDAPDWRDPCCPHQDDTLSIESRGASLSRDFSRRGGSGDPAPFDPGYEARLSPSFHSAFSLGRVRLWGCPDVSVGPLCSRFPLRVPGLRAGPPSHDVHRRCRHLPWSPPHRHQRSVRGGVYERSVELLGAGRSSKRPNRPLRVLQLALPPDPSGIGLQPPSGPDHRRCAGRGRAGWRG